MWNTFGRALGKAVFFAAFLAVCAPAFAADVPEIRCRAGIESGLNSFVIKTLKARLRCQADILDGYESPGANCVTGAGSVSLPGRLQNARSRLLRRIVSSCGGARWNLMSYPGPCPEAPMFSEQTLTQCIDGTSKAVAESLFDVWYPSELTPARGQVTECIKGVAKRASSMVMREMKVRLECLLRNERPDVVSDVDCRGQIPPYGNGTFDDKVNEAIVRAEEAWLNGMPAACVDIFPEVGFGENCPSNGNAGMGLTSFHSCVYRANRLQIPLLVDVAFPSAPVCGNGIRQEGEDCDDGAGNSNTTPDACRSDCTLPLCGDDTTDPSNEEECDDGGHEDLDGCTADCRLEFCGDGQVNDLPNEDCEDGNNDDHDRCTGCKEATCGDGVVCSDPSCTTGPGGGPELCDNGPDNAPGAMCEPDCSGFARSCTMTIGVTNAVTIGSLTYDLVYTAADGELAGIGANVECTSPLTGSLASFFDNENTRKMRESVIVDAGFTAPRGIAECRFVTNDASLAPGDFSFSVLSATDTNFDPVTAVMGVTSLVCQ